MLQEYYVGHSISANYPRDADVVRSVNECMGLVATEDMVTGPNDWEDADMVTGLHAFIKYAVQQRSTLIRNHIGVNVPLRIKYWIKFRLQHLSKRKMNAITDAATRMDIAGEGVLELIDGENSSYTMEEKHSIRSTIQELQQIFGNLSMAESNMRENPWFYLKALKILRDIAIAVTPQNEGNDEIFGETNTDAEEEAVIEDDYQIVDMNFSDESSESEEARIERLHENRVIHQSRNRKLYRKKLKMKKRQRTKLQRSGIPNPRIPKKKKEMKFKVFNLLPHSSPKSKFITIDIGSLHQLDKAIRMGAPKKCPT